MDSKILFGNFIAISHDGKFYRERINISDESFTITAPTKLLEFEMTKNRITIDRRENKKETAIEGNTI
jgi:hypothetical protein